MKKPEDPVSLAWTPLDPGHKGRHAGRDMPSCRVAAPLGVIIERSDSVPRVSVPSVAAMAYGSRAVPGSRVGGGARSSSTMAAETDT